MKAITGVSHGLEQGDLEGLVYFRAQSADVGLDHTLAYYVLTLDAILAFWLTYILTRPLGASLGDYLSQPAEYGGLGLGTIYTSLLFLAIIAAIVVFMTFRHEPEVAIDGGRQL